MSKERPRAGPFQALRHRDFAKVWSAGLISQTGDYLLLIGLPFFVFRLTGSVLATGTMFLVALLPPIFLGSVAGVFVDRWSRKWTMVSTNLVLGVGLLPLLLVTTPDRLWIVYLVALFEACVDPFFSPAEGALIPQLVPAHDLVSANALYGSSRQIARLVGAAAGGLVVGIWGLSGVAGLDAITFWAAAGLVSQIDELRPPLPRASGAMREGFRRLASKFRDEWVDGLRIATRSVRARALLIFTLLISVGEGVVTTLFAPFIVGVLHGSGPDYGAFVGLQAVGGIVGALAASSLGRGVAPEWLVSRLAVVFALLDAVIFTYPLFWPVLAPAFLLIIVVGFPAALMVAGYTTLVQTAVPDTHRGRYLGAIGTTTSVSLVAGVLLATSLADRVGILPMLEVQVAGYLVGGILLPVLLRSVKGSPRPNSGTTSMSNATVVAE